MGLANDSGTVCTSVANAIYTIRLDDRGGLLLAPAGVDAGETGVPDEDAGDEPVLMLEGGGPLFDEAAGLLPVIGIALALPDGRVDELALMSEQLVTAPARGPSRRARFHGDGTWTVQDLAPRRPVSTSSPEFRLRVLGVELTYRDEPGDEARGDAAGIWTVRLSPTALAGLVDVLAPSP